MNKKRKQIVVWRPAYRPFICGGDVHAPVATKIEVGQPIHLARGINVYAVMFPGFKQRIIESKSGGIIGDTLDEVKNDFNKTTPQFVRKQIKEAVDFLKDHPPFFVDPEKFLDF